MAARADDDFYRAEQLREITHCSAKLAEILLSDTNNDLMEAVEKFYGESDVGLEKGDKVGNCREDRFGHEIVGTSDGNLNRVTVKKQRYPQVGEVDSSCNKNPVVDVHGIVTTRPRLKRRMGKKKAKDAEIKGFHDMNGKFSDMKMMNKARPTKEDKFSQLRQELLAYLWEVTTTAGVDEAELMVLEDCPDCGSPQIVQDKTVRLFQCVEGCPAIFCRNCKVYHEPLSCKHWKNGVFGEMEHELEKYVGDITKVESGRLFKNDNLKAEYQMVEGEFLRMMASIGKSLKITRIDMVNNMQLKKKFEMKKILLQYEGLSDTAVLLFHATDDVAVEDVIKNNFAQPLSGDSVYFTETPTVDNDESCLLMCLVLEGTNIISSLLTYRSIQVQDVDQVLPKYVVHFSARPSPAKSGLDWQLDDPMCSGQGTAREQASTTQCMSSSIG